VPTNVVTGFLGVGKTTAVADLLRCRPSGERWAVLVNEFGAVGLDGLLLEDGTGIHAEGISIRELGGGCICCTLSLPLLIGIVELLRAARPDRLLIEASGVGHPAGLLEILTGQDPLDKVLDVRCTVCLLDPADWQLPHVAGLPTYQDQIALGDIIVLNKAENADADTLAAFERWGRDLFPPKIVVATTTQGRLDLAWLDLPRDGARVPLFLETHAHPPEAAVSLSLPPRPGRPRREEATVEGLCACGWLFDPRDVFVEEALLELLLGGYEVRRLKGVFRTDTGWYAINRSGTDVTVSPTAYRRDSRLQLFRDRSPRTWDDFEAALLACLVQ
jgi:G3E family GTPase